MTQRLKLLYEQNVAPSLYQQYHLTNSHQIPRLLKIVVNCGVGEGADKDELIKSTLEDIRLITGQQPIVTRAKKSIAGFNLRQNMAIGVAVTLRNDTMYAFLDRLIHLALPRIRDFQGLDYRSFDGCGNFNLGLKEQLMFPEIEYDKVEKVRGMDISIVTSCRNEDLAFSLLLQLGLPFQKKVRTKDSNFLPKKDIV